MDDGSPWWSSRWATRAGLSVVLVVCVATRLLTIHNPNRVLTGDEALVGLMCKHVVEGKTWPLYLYGQTYGFCLPETLAGSAFCLFMGAKPIALKYGMLLLFALGIVFYYLAASRLTNALCGLFVTLLFLAIPPWVHWSVQIRGGYLFAFLLSAFMVWLVVRQRGASTSFVVVVALLGAVLFHAQPLWLPGLIPLIVARLIPEKRMAPVLAFFVTLGAAIVASKLLLMAYTTAFLPYTYDYWRPQPVQLHRFPATILTLPSQVWKHLSDDLFFGAKVALVYRVSGAIWCALLCLGLASEVRRLLRRDWSLTPHALFLSVAACLGCALFLDLWLRYLLPLSQYLVLWIGYEAYAATRVHTRVATGMSIAAGVVACCGLAGTVASSEYLWKSPPRRTPESCLRTMIEDLQKSGVRHTYSTRYLLQWQIIFYSGETMLSRCYPKQDRYLPYPVAVDKALYGPERTALVGFVRKLKRADIRRLDKRRLLYDRGSPFFAYLDPEPALLRQLDFELHEPEHRQAVRAKNGN